MMIFEVPGEPKGKARPRHSRKTGTTYTPSATIVYEKLVRNCFFITHGKPELLCPVGAIIDCYFKIAKGKSKKLRAEMVTHKIRPIKKPDVDNIGKAILDALNGTAYKDDSQVIECTIRKFYAEEPKVIVTIYPLD